MSAYDRVVDAARARDEVGYEIALCELTMEDTYSDTVRDRYINWLLFGWYHNGVPATDAEQAAHDLLFFEVR